MNYEWPQSSIWGACYSCTVLSNTKLFCMPSWRKRVPDCLNSHHYLWNHVQCTVYNFLWTAPTEWIELDEHGKHANNKYTVIRIAAHLMSNIQLVFELYTITKLKTESCLKVYDTVLFDTWRVYYPWENVIPTGDTWISYRPSTYVYKLRPDEHT